MKTKNYFIVRVWYYTDKYEYSHTDYICQFKKNANAILNKFETEKTFCECLSYEYYNAEIITRKFDDIFAL